jgi:hypothetical protein
VFPFANPNSPSSPDVEALRVGDLPMRRIPVVPARLPMTAVRKIATLKGITLLLVERGEQIVGTVDGGALVAAADDTPAATAMTPLMRWLRPAMSVAEACEVFICARATILPVIAGGFVLGAVTRADVERTRPPVPPDER